MDDRRSADDRQPNAQTRETPPGKVAPPDQPDFVIRRSLRTRLLVPISGLVAVAGLLVLITALSAANNIRKTIETTSTRLMNEQVENYLQQLNRSIAEQNALLLDRAVGDVQAAADAASYIYSSQVPLVETNYNLMRGPEGQYFSRPNQMTSVFIPNTVISKTLKNSSLSLAINQDVEYTTNLDVVFKAIKENNPNAGAIYLGTVHGVLRYYPSINLGELLPADFDPTLRPWYTAAIQQNATQEQETAVWTPVYYDAAGLGLVTTVALPVHDQNHTLVGVVGLDITLNEIQSNIHDSNFSAGSYSFLIDEQGRGIVLPDEGWRDLLGTSFDSNDPTPDLIKQVANPDARVILENMLRGNDGFQSIQMGGKAYYIAYTPFRASMQNRTNTGWSLGTVIPASEVQDRVAGLQSELRNTILRMLFTRVLPLAILMGLGLLGLAGIGTNRVIEPILKLAEASQKLGAGQWEEPLPLLRQIEGRNEDEIGLLANTLTNMANQLRQTFGRLEQRVSERTQELERRTLQIETAAEVAREITQAKDLDSMLRNAVNLISERFGYYNASIFLVDETSEHAHLKASSGELGQKLIQQDIRLRVGEEGIVGQVTRYGRARLANDVRTDRAYLAEPLLTDTRSEVALPLQSGPKIIGALDVQSTRPLAFSEDDVQALQALANQLAIAIENVQLVTRLQASLQETSLLYQQQARQSWERMSAQTGLEAYEYDLLEVKRLEEPVIEPWAAQPGPNGKVLQVPIRLRDQVIGYIGLESDETGRPWSEDEIAIVEATASQAALSVENARLLAESQRRAAREKLAAEVTARMRTSLEMENVLQTAMHELAQRLGIAQIEVHLGSSAGLDHTPQDRTAQTAPVELSTRRNGDEAI